MDYAVIFICIVVLLFLYWLKRNYDFRQIINKIPGRPYPYIVGDVWNLSSHRDKLFLQFREYSKEFPDGFRMWAGLYAVFNINTAQDAESMLSTTKFNNKSLVYKFLEPWLNTGLLTSGGRKWSHRRKLLTPAFHFNILKKFAQIFDEHGKAFVKELESECCQPKTDLVPLMSKLTLNIICETAMGITLDSDSEEQIKYREAIHRFGSLMIERTIRPWFYIQMIYDLTAAGKQQKNDVKILHEFTTKVIKERERTFTEDILENIEEDNDVEFGIYKKKRFALLDLLISAKKNNAEIDDVGIREEVDTFMFEGHDTTASGLCFSFLMLANHKDVQKRVRDEVDNIFKKSDRPANYEDLQKMQYLEMVIKETLRLYPSVPFISREVADNLTFPDGKYIVPPGTVAHTHIYDIHRDPRVFADPETFDPNRFLPENVKGRHPYAYIPFSAGPRNCIGQRFAMLEMKSVISSVLRNYELDPIDSPDDIEMVIDLVLRTKHEVHIKFKPRLYN